MIKIMTERDNLLNDIYFQVDIQEHLANKYNKTPSYISQLAKQLKQLKYHPTIKDNKLICANCKKSYNNLMFYRNHKTNQLIILVCKPCNLELKIKDLGGNILKVKKKITKDDGSNKELLRNKEALRKLYDTMDNYMLFNKEKIKKEKIEKELENNFKEIEELIKLNEYIK